MGTKQGWYFLGLLKNERLGVAVRKKMRVGRPGKREKEEG
jgi:hypothetical protein